MLQVTGAAMAMRRHAVRIETVVHDPIPRPMRFYVIECVCGWSTPLCHSAARARDEYEQHKPRRKARGA